MEVPLLFGQTPSILKANCQVIMNSRIVALVSLAALILATFSKAKGASRADAAPLIRDPQQAALLEPHDHTVSDGFQPEYVVKNEHFKAGKKENRSNYSQNKHKSGSKNSRKASSELPRHSKRSLKRGKRGLQAQPLFGNFRPLLPGEKIVSQGSQTIDLRDRDVPLAPVLHETNYSHEVPDNATVNMFRVNCRRYNNCTHFRKPDDFEPEITAKNGRGHLPHVPKHDLPFENITSNLREDDLRQAVHDPTDELINHLTMFGKDRRVTLWVQHLFRQHQLPTNQDLMDRVDQNFFVGSHHNIGNPNIKSLQAVQQMNYDQYFRHLQITIGRTMHNQRLVHEYGVEKTAQRMMWGHRRVRQRVYESILQMENIIYMEQRTLAKNIRERRRRFDEQQAIRLNATMKALEGKPFYYTVYDRKDIFRD
jgi:hypothetical protein